MTLEVIIIVIITIAGILTALAIRFAYSIHDWAELVGELQDENDALRADTGELCKEKLSLMIDVDDLRSENDHLKKQLDDALTAYENSEKERIRIITATTAKRIIEPEPVEPESAAVKEEKILQANAKERLPEGHTNVISGMPYTTITDKKSEQWALQLQTYTGKYGIRCYFDGDRIYFLAAMGSAYGRTIGDTFRVTLKCGTVMYVMLGEFKDDGTDPNFFGHPTTHADGYDVTCVLEFIYDAEHINSKALQAGNFCNIEYFGGLHGDGGDIVRIEYLGRKWEP